jgi:hypothetical protein
MNLRLNKRSIRPNSSKRFERLELFEFPSSAGSPFG